MPEPIRVVSFNLRYNNPADGPNAWPHRKELAYDTLRALDPDIVGLQEVLADQFADVRAAFPNYDIVGVGRDDGRAGGEFVPIMYRRSRLTLVDRGHLWLSETPERPGSVGWDAALPRMMTWVRLRFRENPAVELCVLNTHFDHRGERARRNAAEFIRRTVRTLGGLPTVVLGDFNAAPHSPPYETLVADRGELSALRDTYLEAGGAETHSGTFNGFTGKRDGPRIDWILVNRRFDVLAAGIDHTQTADRYPSDHFPVHALLEIRPAHRSGMQ